MLAGATPAVVSSVVAAAAAMLRSVKEAAAPLVVSGKETALDLEVLATVAAAPLRIDVSSPVVVAPTIAAASEVLASDAAVLEAVAG